MPLNQLLAFSALLMMFSTSSTNARQWYIEPEVFIEVGQTSDPVLSLDDDIDLIDDDIPIVDPDQSFAFAGGEFVIGSELEDDSLQFGFLGRARRYEDEVLDSEQLEATVEYDKYTLRRDFAIESGYSQDSTIETELEDTGQVQNNLRRTLLFIRPATTIRISELYTSLFALEYRDISFDEDSPGLIAYEDFNANARLERKVSAQFDLTAELDYLKYRPSEEVPLTTVLEEDVVSLLLGTIYQFDERNSISVELGTVSRKTDRLEIDGTTEISRSDEIYRLEYDHTGLRNSAGIELESTYDSSAAGGLSKLERLIFDFYRPLSSRTTFGVSAAYLKRGPVDGETEEREYYDVNPNLTWRSTRSLLFTFDVLFREQKLSSTVSNDSTSADSTSFLIGARYNWGRKLIK